MSDLIDRQAAIDALGEEPPVWYDGEDEIAERNQWKRDIEAIKQLPPIQPEPHEGYWIDKGWNGDWAWQIDGRGNCWRVIECSECGKSVRVESNFCPNCGADMRGEQDG